MTQVKEIIYWTARTEAGKYHAHVKALVPGGTIRVTTSGRTYSTWASAHRKARLMAEAHSLSLGGVPYRAAYSMERHIP